MALRGSTDVKDKIFSALVYLFALYDTWFFGAFLVQQFPFLGILAIPILPIMFIYGFLAQFIGNFASFLVFLLLFLGVVRNERISHFIRYNAMQTILIGIILALFGLIMDSVLRPALGDGLLIQTLYNVAFLGGLAACFYSIVQSILGRYAEIPTISEAAYSQVR